MTDYERLKIREYAHWTLYLSEKQSYLGRLVAWAKRDGDADITSMTQREQQEFFMITHDAKKALVDAFHCDRVNYAALSNEARHLHWHIVPRYLSDRKFDGIVFKDAHPKTWPYDSHFPVPEETLQKIRREILKRL